jgi:hypothetical protein
MTNLDACRVKYYIIWYVIIVKDVKSKYFSFFFGSSFIQEM